MQPAQQVLSRSETQAPVALPAKRLGTSVRGVRLCALTGLGYIKNRNKINITQERIITHSQSFLVPNYFSIPFFTVPKYHAFPIIICSHFSLVPIYHMFPFINCSHLSLVPNFPVPFFLVPFFPCSQFS